MLDPRVGRWFAPDKMEKSLSYFSPYIFVNNNPIQYVDTDGNFLTDVHKRISQNAFMKSKVKLGFSISGFKNYNKLQAYYTAITGSMVPTALNGSCVAPDKRTLPKMFGGNGKMSISSEHFDNMNFTQILDNFQKVNNSIDSALELYKTDKLDSGQLGLVIGEKMHAIQDFYSHSNYVELYEEYFGQTDITSIPTLQEALNEDKYFGFATLLENKLVTGVYPGTGKGSHKQMNHDLGAGSSFEGVDQLEEIRDKKVDWYSKAAEAVATKATIQLNDTIEKVIIE